MSGLFYTILLTFLANYKPWALKEQETQGSLSVSSVHLGQKSRLKQGKRWEATSFLWIKGRGLGRGNRLFPVRTFWIRPPWHASAHRQLGRGQARRNQDLGPASEKRACARGSGQEGWQRGGAAPLRLRTKTPRRKWCAGVWRCEDLPGRWRPRWPAREQDRRRRRRWQRRSWEGGVSPRVVRQDWGGRPRRVGRESGHPRPGGRGARGPVGDSGGECFREEHPPVLAWDRRPDFPSLLSGFERSPGFPRLFLLFKATSGSVSGPPVPRACLSCHEGTVLAELLSLCRWKPCVFFPALQLTSLLKTKRKKEHWKFLLLC